MAANRIAAIIALLSLCISPARAHEAGLGHQDVKSGPDAVYRVAQHGKWGFINVKGEFVIQPSFEAADDFNEGLARVMIGGKWGYIDAKGQTAIEPKYSDAGDFAEGLAPVELDGKWGYIDPKGEFAIKPQFFLKGSKEAAGE